MPRSARTIGLLVLVIAVLTAGAPSMIRIKPGDTLSELAATHHTTVAALQQANHLSGTMIYAGRLLTIPGSATPAVTSTTSTREITTSYLVRSGDSLIGLAQRFHTTTSQIIQRNRLTHTMIWIGQRLSFVSLATTTSTTASPVAEAVARSASLHRSQLSRTQLPSKGAVQALIRTAATRHGVPVPLALALAYQESGFQMSVVSPVDAVGAMQVLPSTAHTLGLIHGRTFNLLVAADNVEAGVVLLRDLLDATGSGPGAMAGYYQGLGSISRIGLLPETKAYIRNITQLSLRFA